MSIRQKSEKQEIEVAVVYNDGDRSGINSWTPAIKIQGMQFDYVKSFSTKDLAEKVAKTVADMLGIEEIEEVRPIW